MATKSKRQPSNTIATQVNAMVGAAKPLPEIPPHIRVRYIDRPFLNVILRSRLREEWTGPELALAVQLAAVQADMEVETLRLEGEGSMINDRFGELVINPRQKLIDGLARRALALMRSMKLTGTEAHGDKRNLSKARALQRQAEDVRDGLSDEELLA